MTNPKLDEAVERLKYSLTDPNLDIQMDVISIDLETILTALSSLQVENEKLREDKEMSAIKINAAGQCQTKLDIQSAQPPKPPTKPDGD